jgi:hypothetical protein
MGITNSDPAGDITNVTPDDDNDLEKPFRAVRCATGGDVKYVTLANNTRTAKFTDGETRPICGTRILSTGTTAVDIEAYH